MEIKNIPQEQFVDMFNMNANQSQEQNSFNAFNQDSDIFKPKTEETTPPVETETKLDADGKPIVETKLDENGQPIVPKEEENNGIFMHDEDKAKLGRKPKYSFSDTTGYFEDRIKAGKFIPIEEEKDGKVQNFIPKSPEDFDEFFDLQLNHKFEEKIKEVEEGWYTSKSPAWQAVAKYAEHVDNPAELVPFLEGVKNIQSVSAIDASQIEGAEKIVRIRMQNSGDPAEAIEEQIEALKATNKLITSAERFKPVLIQQEQQRLQTMQQEKELQERQYASMVNLNSQKAVEAIESPIFGKQKLQREEKALVYDLIGQPDPKQGGYGIYSVIDSLYEKGDFQTLRDIALLIGKKDSFLNYAGKSVADKTAENLQRKLRVSTASNNSGASDYEAIEQQPQRQPSTVINRSNDGFRRS